MAVSDLVVEYRRHGELRGYPRNAREHPPEQIEQIKASYRRLGFFSPVLLKDDRATIGAGHGRWIAAGEMIRDIEQIPGLPALDLIPTIVMTGLSEEEWRLLVLADNRIAESAGWNEETLKLELGELKALGIDFDFTGFSLDGLGNLGLPSGSSGGGGRAATGQASGVLKERFGVPPFSVLNAREGWWQDRKRAWLGLGIQSEVGRDENLLKFSDTVLQPDPQKRETASLKGGLTFGTTAHPYDGQDGGAASKAGTSIFDPVLCELAVRWFCPPRGTVLDPFAGGSVRGIVAAKLGRSYVGIDLRPEQVEANRGQAAEILGPDDGVSDWICGDAADMDSFELGPADFIWSCPPYADLERYSDDPRDLSTMEYDQFVAAYRNIIAAACRRLKPNRFAAFVVGDVRARDSAYRGFVRDTELAFEAAGLRLYNEAILVTAVSSLAMRAGKQFAASRKLGKAHQNCLVFLKGDAKKAVKAIGEVEFGEIEDSGQMDAIGQPNGGQMETKETKYGEKITSLGGEV